MKLGRETFIGINQDLLKIYSGGAETKEEEKKDV